MHSMGTRSVICGAVALLLASVTAALCQAQFPFEHEILLDVRPLPGSRRVPILEVFPNGRATIDLWCRSGQGQVEISGDGFRLALGPMREEGCTPERQRRDEDMMVALEQITQWRIESDRLVLIGPTELRFRLSTH